MNMDVTLMVKTMYRPEPLTQLLQSIRARYTDMPVHVVDDTPTIPNEASAPYPEVSAKFKGVTHDVFKADIGIGHCLNHILDTCDTEAVVLLEDDFSFNDMTKLELLWPYIHGGLFDILGGAVRGVKNDKLQRFMGVFEFKRPGHAPDLILEEPDYVKDIREFEVLINFFMARTDALRELRWDPDLKVARHIDFFLRAAGFRPGECPKRKGKQLAVGYHPGLEILHHSPMTHRAYQQLRHGRLREYQQMYLDKWGFVGHGITPAT